MANRFLNNITINDSYTLPSSDGSADQIIQTDGAGNLTFIDPSALAVGESEQVHIACKNTSGVAISKGDPVYITGTVGTSYIVEIAKADASNSAKMPAVGLAESDLAINAEGFVIVSGVLKNLTTDPLSTGDGTPSSNNTVYVKVGGGLTRTKPTGSSNLIQNVGKVGRVSSANAGSVAVSTIMRTNDVPNLTTGKIWVGSPTYTTESTVVHLDETNGRMGIGTTDPKAKFQVIGPSDASVPAAGSGVGGTAIFSSDLNTYGMFVGSITNGNGYIQQQRTNTATYYNLLLQPNGGNVGIGTTSPQSGGSAASWLNLNGTAAYSGGVVYTINNSAKAYHYVEDTFLIHQGQGGIGHRFFANGSEKMRIESGGNVGIGTTTPDVSLEVVAASPTDGIIADFVNSTNAGGTTAAIKLSNSDSESCDVILGANRVGANFGSDFFISTSNGIDGSNSERFRITESGNIGIGTTSPSQKLTVEGNIELGTGGYIYGDTTTPALRLNNSSGSYLQYGTGTYFAAGNNALTFRTSSSTRMFINSSGNVGIGTTSPTTRLDLGASNTIGTGLGFGSTSSELRRGNSGNNVQLSHWANLSMIIDSDNNDTTRYFNVMHGANDSSTATELFRVQENGDVGIGTTSPTQLLHIAGASATAIVTLQRTNANTSGSYGALQWTASDDHTVAAIDARGDGDNEGAHLLFHTTSAAASNDPYGINERMRIDSSGNVGIGTTSPSEKLAVGGNLLLNNAGEGWIKGFDDYHSIKFRAGGDNKTEYYEYGGTLAAGLGHKFFTGGTTSQTLRLQIADNGSYFSGNVGIGTDNPVGKLNVALPADSNGDVGAWSSNQVVFTRGGTSTSQGIGFSVHDANNTATISSLTPAVTWSILEYKALAHFFYSTGNTLGIMQDSNGNVGIRTTSPSQTLEVAGTGIKLVNAANTHTHLLLDTANYDYKLGDISTSGGAYFQILGSSHQTFIYNSDLILSDGQKITITRSNPADPSCIYVDNTYTSFGTTYNIDSDVSSTLGSRHIGFRYNGTIVGFIGTNGTTAVTYSTTSSDERLKKNIEDWQENILDKFEKIQPKKFNFVSEEEGESKTKGFIAQNMAEDFPEAYPHDYSEDKYYSFNPSGMVVYLMKAVKDLVEQNKQLETRIQTLEQEKL